MDQSELRCWQQKSIHVQCEVMVFTSIVQNQQFFLLTSIDYWVKFVIGNHEDPLTGKRKMFSVSVRNTKTPPAVMRLRPLLFALQQFQGRQVLQVEKWNSTTEGSRDRIHIFFQGDWAAKGKSEERNSQRSWSSHKAQKRKSRRFWHSHITFVRLAFC